MDYINAIILGIVQGLSEFLPVSSSGHLVLAAEILNFKEEGATFEVFVHTGTLLAVFIAFRRELKNMMFAPWQIWIQKSDDETTAEFLQWDFNVIVGSIPAAFIGLLYKDEIERLFSDVLLVIIMLFITASFMFMSKYIPNNNKLLNLWRSFIIGIAQAFAILPGISRSGSTIVTGMALGVNREKVAKFSFILSIPAVLGATLIKLNDLLEKTPGISEVAVIVLGTSVSFIAGYLAILWLLDVVRKGKLEWFGYYCYAISLTGFLWYLFY